MNQQELLAELESRVDSLAEVREDEFTVTQYHKALISKGISISRRGVQDKLSNMTAKGLVTRRIARLETGKTGYAYKFVK
jgi:predicted DNA-binding transcriptional regulator